MEFIYLNLNRIRPKSAARIQQYLDLSKHNKLSIGLYKNGSCYVFGGEDEMQLFYDIGSITKTVTAHLILKLFREQELDIHKTVDEYLPLKKGKYPTVYQLLTHTAGYGYLTPAEITVPSLLRHGYARKNPYERCTVKTVIKCLERRRFGTPKTRYGYSDFAPAVLAAIAEEITKIPFSTLLEGFVRDDLGLDQTTVELDPKSRYPLAANGKQLLPFWIWHRDNPYIAGGGLSSNIGDILKYLALQIESNSPYIADAHTVCGSSEIKGDNHLMCIGWHTYKKSNQLWHVGGVGTFRTSVIINKKLKLGVAVLGNAKGRASANAHYIAKMLYSELKNNRIKLKEE